MPFPVGRKLPSVFRVIRSLHNLPDHIVYLDGLVSARAALSGSVIVFLSWIPKFQLLIS